MAVSQLIFWWNFMMLRRWSWSIKLPTKFRYLRCPVWTLVSPSSSICTQRTPRAPAIPQSSTILLRISKDWVWKVCRKKKEVEDIILYLPPAEFLCYSIRNCISFNRIEEHLLCWIFFSGVTDFKAVVDSSTSDAPPTSYSLLLITSSVGGIFVVTVLTLCIVFTYRRKVRSDQAKKLETNSNFASWDTETERKWENPFSSGIPWMVFCLCPKVIYYKRKNPFS